MPPRSKSAALARYCCNSGRVMGWVVTWQSGFQEQDRWPSTFETLRRLCDWIELHVEAIVGLSNAALGDVLHDLPDHFRKRDGDRRAVGKGAVVDVHLR